MADGTLRFDTEIDESGFQKGLKRIEQAAKGATQQTASDARDAAKQAEQDVSQATEEAGKDAEKAAKQVVNTLEEIQDAAEDAADAITDAAEDAGQDAAESVQDAVDNIVESVEEAGESAAEAVEDAMSDVADSVSDAAKDVGDSASDIGDSIGDGFEEGTDQASTAIDALAQALLAAGVTASVKAITDALMDCTQASMEFETAMAKVGTIADESQKPLGDMRNEILALSSETGKSVGELAEATYQAISASVATESAVDFVGTANKLAVGGFSDTTTAVDILTTAINAYGMSADDASKISDVLITTQNLGKTSVAQLGASMGMVIPLAAAYNMNLEDLAASYALLTANGTQTAQATTYVKAALNELGSTSSVVGSTLKKQTGKTFAELMAEGNSLGDVLQVLADSVDGDTTAFNNMWSSSEAGVGMLSILNSGTSKYNSLVQAMEGSTGAATTAFEKMSETGEFAQQRFQNAIENLKIAIGDELAPVLMELQQSGADAMEWATEFVKEHPEVVAAVTALAAALAVLAAALVGLLVVNQVSKAFEAFSAALLANPFGLVALALVSLTAATVAFGKIMKDRTSDAAKNRKAIEQCRKSYNNLKDSIEEHEETAKENIKSAETEAATYQTLSDKLYDLANKTSKTAAEKAQMSAMVDQLNEAMPELGLSIDETTGALNKEKSAVDAVIDSMKQQALASAYQEQVKQAATDVAEAETQLSEARKVYNGLLVESRNETQEYNKAMQDTGNMVESTSDIYDAHGVKQTELNERLQEQKKVIEDLEGTYSEAQEKLSEASEKAGEYKVTTEETNEAVSDSATEMSDEVKQAYEGMKTSIQNSLKGVVNAYEDFSGGEEISAGDVVTHLKSAANGVDQWADNLITLAGRAGEGMTKEFFSYLVDLGPQSANLVKACTEMSKKELQDAVAAYSESGGEAAEAYSEKLAAIITNWDSTGQEIAQAAGEAGEKSGKEHTEKAKSGIESGQKEVTEAAKKGGEEAGKVSQKATADGIQQNSGQVSQAASSSIRKAEDAALGYYNGFYNVGANLMRGTVAGMTANSPAVEEAARAAVRNAVTGAKKEGNIKSPSRVMRDEVGEMLAAGMAVGIDEGSGDVEKSARDLAKVSVDATKDELGIHSPSKVFKNKIGKNIVSGVIKGIEAEVPKLKKTMKKMSEEAVKAAGEVDAAKGGYSEAASAIMESITSGLDKRQELLVSKLDNKIDGYVDKVVKKYEKLAEDKKTEAGNTTDATQKKKLQEEAKKFRKNAKKIKNYANKYTSTFKDALKEGTEKAYSKIEDDLDKKLDEIAEKYQKAYDRIISFRDDMKKKMSDPANMYDLDTQLTQVERYQEGLKKLKDKIPESLMDQILGMDLNEADNFVEHLNAMSEEELEAYKKKWEQLQGSSETYSKEFFEQRLTDTKAGWTKEVEEAAKTAQEATEEAGKKIAKSLIKSLNGEKETLKKSMRGIAKDMIEAFKKAFGLGKSNKSAKSTKTSTNAKGTTTSGKTTAKKKKAKGTDDSELDLETLKANAASKKKIQKLAKKGRLSEVGKVLEALPTPFEDTEQKKAALQKLDPKLLASLDRFEQTVNQLGNFITVSNAGNASIGKLLEAASNQTIQLQAELHTTVDLDGRTVGKAVTPYVNENMNTIRNRQRRGS
ncbi:phage tail tape measure protein [Hominisplanchenecus sp.]|uniref:phage tail tape measure protein n=1 Tax=Hominisplanchenecus sp. TaxID=3038130 RepID=UPI0039958DB3